MKYEKLNFVNGSPPAVNAASLNHIESGIVDALEAITTLEEEIKNKPNADDVYSAEEADEHFLSAVEPGGSVKTANIANGAVSEAKLDSDFLEKVNSKLEKSKIEPQISTTIVDVAPEAEQLIKPTDKVWEKDSVLRITILADESVINGTVTIGTWKDGSSNSTKIVNAGINETIIYITTGETEIIGAYIPVQSIIGGGKVTLKVESLGLKSDVAELCSEVVGLKETVESQTSTFTTKATSGSGIFLSMSGKKWVKDTTLKIAITANNSVANGKIILGIKHEGDTSSTEIARPLINETVTYLTTADTVEIACSIPKESVIGNGEVTMTVESLGVRTEIVDLKEKVSGLEADIENLREETSIAKSSIEGKTFSILGDSISTFAGWIPEGRKAFYGDPAVDVENYVPSVTQMWWYILSSQLKMPLLANDSWMGTTISTTGYKQKIKDENGNITEGPPADMSATAFPKRAESLFGKNNTTSIKPDYIFIFGGTNDYRAGSPVGDTMYRDWASGYTEDWTEENEKEALKSVLPSFCKLVHDIKLYNPHATIVNITFDELKDTDIGSGYAKACEHYGIINVVLEDIEMPVDEKGTPKGHPAWEGQLSIAEQVINKLREEDASIKTCIDVSEVGM